MDKERREKTVRAQDAEADGIIEGRNAVIEALRAGATIDKIFIQKGRTAGAAEGCGRSSCGHCC